MTRQFLAPRKRRTREHVIADLSIHHVEGFILEAGHTTQRLGSDYGYDLIAWTFDERGYAEPGALYFQFKAMETLRQSGRDYVYDLDIRDYNLWIRETSPVILILYDAARKRAVWLPVQEYFHDHANRPPKKGAKSIRVRVARRRVVNRQAVARMRIMKETVQ
jgi:hypothetical protein